MQELDDISLLREYVERESGDAFAALVARHVNTVALAKGATASTPTLTLIKGVLKIMAWTKTKTALVAGVATLLVAGTATVVVKKTSHPIRITADPVAVESPLSPQGVGPSLGRAVPDGVDSGHTLSSPNPNARFAELTLQQRVQQARRHLLK